MRMIRCFFLLILFSGILVSCKQKFNVNADWQDITIVYGILNQGDTLHYIKVTKAFLGPGDALQYAKIPIPAITLRILKSGSMNMTTLHLSGPCFYATL